MTNALAQGRALALDTVQVFTKNQQQWSVPPVDPGAAREWLAELGALGWTSGITWRGRDWGRVVAHASYLINLASPNSELWEKSVRLMRVEIERCAGLGIPWLVHHPGSPTGTAAAEGMDRIARAYRRLFKETRGAPVVLCLENTVGAGSTLGGRFEELAELRARIVEATGEPHRVGFCFDTCHAHAAGYDMGPRAAAKAVLESFDTICGLEHLAVVHINDSKAADGFANHCSIFATRRKIVRASP
ncbi:deoxyribonuclease IV [Leptolyngbya sp. 7M]|uniref:deoxyribonuclease IV n=1 Tax=Leptolyngbya sp. 7M TaxID=2812896 RepID=UPI001B8C61D9|nr:deoxyribonuclease IV [Leptolyngbya sp. 7M]